MGLRVSRARCKVHEKKLMNQETGAEDSSSGPWRRHSKEDCLWEVTDLHSSSHTPSWSPQTRLNAFLSLVLVPMVHAPGFAPCSFRGRQHFP